MKKVYLQDENYNLIVYKYDGNICDALKDILTKNKISISYSANIGDSAKIGDYAKIGDKIILINGFYLNGSKHCVTYVGQNKISIGCHTKEIEWFKNSFDALGKKEGYSPEQIKEYYNYIILAEMFAKNSMESVNDEVVEVASK